MLKSWPDAAPLFGTTLFKSQFFHFSVWCSPISYKWFFREVSQRESHFCYQLWLFKVYFGLVLALILPRKADEKYIFFANPHAVGIWSLERCKLNDLKLASMKYFLSLLHPNFIKQIALKNKNENFRYL